MRLRSITFVLSIAALAASACSKKDQPTAEQASASASAHAASAHAPPNVRPGSHEDWCGEHGVPESLCSRCNPELEAAFKATGDWCEEHGLPESQCVKCNPDLKIVRPAKAN